MSDDSDARELAIKRLHQKQAFKAMLVTYIAVNAVLWVIWALGNDHSGVPWPVWVTAFWGLGLVLTGWSAYGARPISEDDVQREMDRTRGGIDPSR